MSRSAVILPNTPPKCVVHPHAYNAENRTSLDFRHLFGRILKKQLASIDVCQRSVGSPYINRFLQPDSIIPNPANPQAFNRFSYVGNNPINFNDPTGHIGCKPGQRCLGNPKVTAAGATRTILDATIRIGSGELDEEGNPIGRGGLGTVVGDRKTIVTARHVILPDSTYLFLRAGNNGEELTILDMDEVVVDYSQSGDVVVITVPEELPDSFIPATATSDHEYQTFQNLTVAYQDENRGLHILETQVTWPSLTYGMYDWTLNVLVENPNSTLTSGDSGGGVFYDGVFVGVTSFLDTQFGESVMAFQPFK